MRIVYFIFAMIIFASCSPLAKRALDKKFKSAEAKFHDHKGFIIYDPAKRKMLYEYNSASYFTPASNTKILTFLTSLSVLGDSMPSLKWTQRNDSILFWGLGDPSFLYDEVHQNHRVYDFLKQAPSPLYFSSSNFHTAHFGSGWAWDDYNSAYSAERSPLPIYGNCFFVYPSRRRVSIWPSFFTDKIATGDAKPIAAVIRDPFSNQVKYHPGQIKTKEWMIPFRVDQNLITTLLMDTLRRTVTPITKQLAGDENVLFGGPVDSLYSVMMKDSDNLIAEHLLLACAGVLSDSLQPEIAIRWMEKNILNDLPDKITWVDGSGLSRYNLVTPRSIVAIWRKIFERVNQERLFSLLATGGQPGTLKNWYQLKPPYVFGKTGTLSNNHALSGFLVTRSGKILIFCFMNANFTASMNDIRKNMQDVIDTFYEKY